MASGGATSGMDGAGDAARSGAPRGESDLVRRLKAGDDAAFEELVRGAGGRLLAVARRLSRSEADAEDIVQETFVSAYKGISAFDGRSTMSTWLHRIAVNAALQHARRSRARPASSIEELLPVFENGEHRDRPLE